MAEMSAPEIPYIIVPAKAYNSERASDLVSAVVDFCNIAIRRCMYVREELPQNALRSFHADYYHAQVDNGGHEQYIKNSRWISATIDDCQECLQAMSAGPFLDCHTELLFFAHEHLDRFAVARQEAFSCDPVLRALDKRFYAADRNTPLYAIQNSWLKSLGEMKPIADEAYDDAINALAKDNPAWSARAKEREDARKEAVAVDPLDQAFTFLCANAKPEPITYFHWLHARKGLNTGDGRFACAFVLRTSAGFCTAFLHEVKSILVLSGKSPVPVSDSQVVTKMPTKLVDEWVLEKTGKTIPPSTFQNS